MSLGFLASRKNMAVIRNCVKRVKRIFFFIAPLLINLLEKPDLA